MTENTSRRIRKNAKKQIAQLCAGVKVVKSYSLHSNFTGVEFEPKENWAVTVTKELYSHKSVSLTVNNEKHCTLHIHSNQWYEWSI